MEEYHEIKMPPAAPVVRYVVVVIAIPLLCGQIVKSFASPRKGKMKPIQIMVEQRQGSKTVTKITNLEQFEVDVEELASQLKVRCASSTTGESHWVKFP